MLKTILKNHKLFFLFLTLVFISPAIYSLFHPGFPLTDDGNWMIIRFSAFYEALRAGEFPVRFLMRLNNGYGYPVSNFLYPLFMYLAVPIHILGFSFVNSIKIILALSLVSSSAFAFLWLRKSFDNIASFTGAIFYTLFPYQLFDLYKRGSIGEILSLSILPFALWQIERKSLFFTSISVAAIVMAHNTLAIFFIPLIFAYSIIKDKNSFKFILNSILLSLGLSAFFWIPAVYDLQYTVFSNTKISELSPYFINNNVGLLGIITVFLILEGLFYLVRKKDKLFMFILSLFLILIVFTFSYSELLWKILPFTNLIQFPFRILSLIIPLGAFMTAYLLNKEKTSKKNILAVVYLILIFASSWNFMFPKSFQIFPDTYYSTNQATTTVKNEYMPKWVKTIPSEMYRLKVEILNGKETPEILVQKANKTSSNVFLEKARTIQINTIYFPGWTAFVNGKKANIMYDNSNGVIQIKLDKGQNNVDVLFKETNLRLVADLISLISFAMLIILFSINKISRKTIHT